MCIRDREINESQFYPTDEQLTKGFGDDVLRVFDSCGPGALKGWDGQKAIHVTPVETLSLIHIFRRISPLVRSAANYDTSLQVISHISKNGVKSKSGIMVGLGETPEEVETLMDCLLYTSFKCRLHFNFNGRLSIITHQKHTVFRGFYSKAPY